MRWRNILKLKKYLKSEWNNYFSIYIYIYENWSEEKLLAELVYRVRSWEREEKFALYEDAFVGRARNLWGLHGPYVIQLSQGIRRMKGKGVRTPTYNVRVCKLVLDAFVEMMFSTYQRNIARISYRENEAKKQRPPSPPTLLHIDWLLFQKLGPKAHIYMRREWRVENHWCQCTTVCVQWSSSNLIENDNGSTIKLIGDPKWPLMQRTRSINIWPDKLYKLPAKTFTQTTIINNYHLANIPNLFWLIVLSIIFYFL